MNVDGTPFRTIWTEEPGSVCVIDQRRLPHEFVVSRLRTVDEVADAIRSMTVRGAGLIGATAAYGMSLAAFDPAYAGAEGLRRAAHCLIKTRPTARNLEWAVERCLKAADERASDVAGALREMADRIADEDADFCRRIGEHGLRLIETIAARKRGGPLRILTHCNAGWLAFVDYGSATAPIYAAFDRGIDLAVWVDETRPRNQGAALTAWELGKHGVPHAIVTDNAGGHLMQHGLVDLVIVGADRVTRKGDAANKVGTYLKALAAQDNGVPFYVALPSSTFDWTMDDGVSEIPIEERSPDEILWVGGCGRDGRWNEVRIAPEGSGAFNIGFDVTPARLIDALITERGVCVASESGIADLYPEHKR